MASSSFTEVGMPSSARAAPRIQRTTDTRGAASAWGKSVDAEVEQPARQDGVSGAGHGFEFHFTNFNQFERKVQSFPVVAKPTLLALSQLVRRRLDLGEEELVVTEYNQIWPSRTAPPVVLD